ncbi:MAG: hypothetical protein IIX68_06425 [Clostridia bacterium]|nr:hypothetical protein [Clostridia bacterium]
MKIAIIGSRRVPDYTEKYVLEHIPSDVTEIVSGGADGIDRIAAECARILSVPLREFLPEYGKFGKAAPLERNKQIVHYADRVLAFWDGRSRGTQQVITYCIKNGIPVRIFPLYQEEIV